jgi:hypothetical protein
MRAGVKLPSRGLTHSFWSTNCAACVSHFMVRMLALAPPAATLRILPP